MSGYALFSDAKEWLRSEAETCDDRRLAKLVNDVRRHFYLMYEDVDLFLDVQECFEVQSFPLECNGCSDCYRGVTLPRGYHTIEAMWFNNAPVDLRSGWREYQEGIAPECDRQLQAISMGDNFPTERELGHGYGEKLKFLCVDPADRGKRVVVRGMDIYGVEVKETVTLDTRYVETANRYASLHRPAGIVKDTTIGAVIVAEHEGRILSRYAPDERIPAYRRVKITGLPDDCAQVNIRASRRFIPLFDDNDVVESDNSLAFEEMARFVRLNSKVNKEDVDMRAAKMHYTQAKALMLGEKARDLGKATKTDLKIATCNFTPRRLFGRF